MGGAGNDNDGTGGNENEMCGDAWKLVQFQLLCRSLNESDDVL